MDEFASVSLKSLRQILEDVPLVIPDYQRPYSWAYEQLQDIWNDIQNICCLKEGENVVVFPYFIGNITFAKSDYFEGKIEIVDGQQRIITLLVLLKSIYDVTAKAERSTTVQNIILEGLFSGRRLKEFVTVADYDCKIFNDKIASSITHKESDIVRCCNCTEYVSEKKLLEALLFFRRKLKQCTKTCFSNVLKRFEYEPHLVGQVSESCLISKFKNVNDYYNCLLDVILNKIVFTVMNFKIPSLSAHILFESNNCRGLQLTSLQLTKNRLLYISQYIEDSKLSTDIVLSWKFVHKKLASALLGKPEDENQLLCFVSQLRSTSKVESSSIHLYKELCKEFEPRNFETTGELTKKCNDYLRLLTFATSIYCDMYSPSRDGVLDDNFQFSERKEGIIDNFLYLNWLGNLSPFGPLIIAAAYYDSLNGCNGEELFDIVQVCVKFYLCVFAVKVEDGKSFSKNKLWRWAGELHSHQLTVSDLKSRLYEAIISHVTLTDYKDFFTNPKINFTNWRFTKFFLYLYELELRSNSSSETQEPIPDFADLTIEHVIPRQYKDNTYWYKEIPILKTDNSLVNCLGNLSLSLKNWNSSYGNSSFHKKRDSYPFGYLNSPLLLERELCQFDSWDETSISQRQTKLASYAVSRFYPVT